MMKKLGRIGKVYILMTNFPDLGILFLKRVIRVLEVEVRSDDIKLDAGNGSKKWSGMFKTTRSMGNLQYFEPKRVGGKLFITPQEAIVEGVAKWRTCLVGQFMDKSLPYFLVKKAVSSMWRQYGDVEVFSLENGMFIFRLQDEASCDDILDS